VFPARSINVFISSAMAELEYDREVAAEVLQSMNVSPILFEVFPAMSSSPSEAYLDAVRSSDIFLMLLWKSYRPAVKDEYEEAVKRNKPILILVKWLSENENRDGELNDFLKELSSDLPPPNARRATWKHYGSVADLRTAVRESIVTEIAKFYREPVQTLGREEMYELGTEIVRNTQRRPYLYQRTPSLILGARAYLKPDSAKYACERRFADELDRWVQGNYKDPDKEFLCAFSPEATKREMQSCERGLSPEYLVKVRENIARLKNVEEESSFRFRITYLNVPVSGPLIVGDNRYALWLLGKDDTVSIAQENEKVCDILVRMLKLHCQAPTSVQDLVSALELT